MTSKIKCILLDDELLGLKYLKMLCEQIQELEIVAVFDNPLVFLEQQKQLNYQLLILDINMPQIDGLSVAQLVPTKGIIFTTAYKEYAVEAFEIDAIDYLTKPLRKDRLLKAVHKAMRNIEKEEKPLFITSNTNKGKAVIYFEDILLITTSEDDPRDKEVLLINDGRITLKNISLDKLLEVLPHGLFVRVNKREIIAYKAVQFFSYDEITTTIFDVNNKPLLVTIGAAFKSDFLANM
ncbi:response regulator [Myroides albus]|uniref:Response regulator n=1 Tax=Myroides albus TaxID=2562892 RepID=A0A6I3LLE8_9FLAO|nr:response regulator [Myroides albus]MTG99173.1 response regulator [Myroides albus]UVD80197.1 response regulator [Myroides albus]